MIFIVKTKIMATLNFTTAYSTTLEGVLELTPSITVYADDLGLCQPCVDVVGNCWACLQTTQEIFSDVALTTPVTDGYYKVSYNEENSNAIWKIVGGFPQGEEFYN